MKEEFDDYDRNPFDTVSFIERNGRVNRESEYETVQDPVISELDRKNRDYSFYTFQGIKDRIDCRRKMNKFSRVCRLCNTRFACWTKTSPNKICPVCKAAYPKEMSECPFKHEGVQ